MAQNGEGPTCGELIELALCTPQMGCVNFNILRILLREIVEKTGIDKKPARVSDVEAGQVENYKNYVRGSGATTPGPGVLKIGPQPDLNNGGTQTSARDPGEGRGGGGGGGPGPAHHGHPVYPKHHHHEPNQGTQTAQKPPQTPKTPTAQRPPAPPQQQQQQQQQQHPQASQSPRHSQDGPQNQQGHSQPAQSQPAPQQYQAPHQQSQPAPQQYQAPQQQAPHYQPQPPAQQYQQPAPQYHPPQQDTRDVSDLKEKVAKLEKHLDTLYQLPTNKEIIEKAKGGEAAGAHSVSDMWQIIQLNNRIAAAEAAIQKMASLIEDLAKNVGRVKSDTKIIKKDASDMQIDKSDLKKETRELADKCDRVGELVGKLQNDLANLKTGWKNDRDNIEKALGTQLGKVPSFMARSPDQESGRGGYGDPIDRGTQTHIDVNDARFTPERKQDQASTGTRGSSPPRSQQASQRSEAPASSSQPPSYSQPPSSSQPPSHSGPTASSRTPQKEHKPEAIAQMTPQQIVAEVTPTEVRQIPTEILNEMTPEQKKAVNKVKKSAPASTSSRVPVGLKTMPPEKIQEVLPEKIAKMPYEEAVNLPPEVTQNMTGAQKQKLQQVIEKGPQPASSKTYKQRQEKKQEQQAYSDPEPPAMGVAAMNKAEIREIAPEEIIQEMPFEEAVNLSPAVLEKMTPAQQEAVHQVVEAGPTSSAGTSQRSSLKQPEMGVAEMLPQEIKEITPAEIIREMPYEEAKSLPKEVLKEMTPAQQQAVQKVVASGPSSSASEPVSSHRRSEAHEQAKRRSSFESARKSRASLKPERKTLTTEEIEDIAAIPAELLAASITPEQAAAIPEEELQGIFDERQIHEIEKMQQKAKGSMTEESQHQPHYVDDYTTASEVVDEEVDASQHRPSLRGKTDKHAFKHKPKAVRKHDRNTQHDEKHTRVDVLHGPIPIAPEPEQLPAMTIDDFLGALPPEEAAKMAADTVQKELQKQYQHLQGMQRQLASDIQDKMEFVYQKLLKEIATQNMTTSPYMTVGGPEEPACLGPGVCTGYGMPAGIAVCQFPEVKDNNTSMDGKVCPGPGVCPGSDTCPHCRVGGKPGTALDSLKAPGTLGQTQSVGGFNYDEALQEMQSLILLDLEKIREEMRTKTAVAFDEKDMVERLNAVWEALKILKKNEETLAVKIARQDAFFKKIPAKTIDKLHKIPEENLDALATGNFQKPMYVPDETRKAFKDAEASLKGSAMSKGLPSATGADTQDIQTLFNNLANVIAECAEQKDRVANVTDTVRILESAMVTKQMLQDTLTDKADKGLINTKVSYDEFGNTIDELHTQLHNLMVEGFQRNENWKKVTSELAEEIAQKLDKVELSPIRQFFKTHMKALEDRVKQLAVLVEEPDSAGTRKKLLRDLNCISCDRKVSISGVTSVPNLPMLGPIPAGHQTASKIALELHRMRMAKRFDPNAKNMNALEQHKRGIAGRFSRPGTPKTVTNGANIANDMDVMDVVNRYTGGSHTSIANADIIAANKRRSSSGSGAAAAPSSPDPGPGQPIEVAEAGPVALPEPEAPQVIEELPPLLPSAPAFASMDEYTIEIEE